MDDADGSGTPLTALLRAWRGGNLAARDQLFPAVYDELHRLARRYMRGERVEHTLQTSALVNEAYLRLIDAGQVQWQDRAHFFALSAQMMRRILVDAARRRRFAKRGGGAHWKTFDEGMLAAPGKSLDLVALDDALEALAKMDPRKSQVIELRFFGGLSVEETADVLKVSSQTVHRDWQLAKAWLTREVLRGAANES